jgi:hypothetical protein
MSNVLGERYWRSDYGNDGDGVDWSSSHPSTKFVYYLDDIKYVDYVSGIYSGETHYSFTPQGMTDINFDFSTDVEPYDKLNLVGAPKIDDDVFIVRQQLPAFDTNYRLEFINNLSDLNSYVGGVYFNVVENNK